MKIPSVVGALVLVLVSSLSVIAQSRPGLIKSIDRIATEDQLNEWLTYYYLHPRPDLVVSAVQYMSGQGLLLKPNASTPFCIFLANVFAANPAKVETWFEELRTGKEDQRSALALTLWRANTSGSESLLKALSKEGSAPFQQYVNELLADNHHPDLLHNEIDKPGRLDALWAGFFATGDERYVKRIIGALPLFQEKDDVGQMLIGGAAKWSLASNAYQHPKVMQICEAQLKELPPDQQAVLAEVIKTARERQK